MTTSKSRTLTTVLLCLVALLPFVPGAFEFARRGIPDLLFTGDGAALELAAVLALLGVHRARYHEHGVSSAATTGPPRRVN